MIDKGVERHNSSTWRCILTIWKTEGNDAVTEELDSMIDEEMTGIRETLSRWATSAVTTNTAIDRASILKSRAHGRIGDDVI